MTSLIDCEGRDVTLDTNVLVHSKTPTSPYYVSAYEVLDWLRTCKSGTRWVLDDQGQSAPNPDTSVLYMEYRKHLPPQSLPMILLVHFLKASRIHWSARPDTSLRKSLRELVPGNKHDQAILGAAVGSTGRFLVSNDFNDFPASVRDRVRRELETAIVSSVEACEGLASQSSN